MKPTEVDSMNRLRVQAEREVARLKDALREIAGMDPKGLRADDLGRAAQVARAALAADGKLSDGIPCGRPAKGLCQGGPECWCGWDNVAKQCVAAECRCESARGVNPLRGGEQ